MITITVVGTQKEIVVTNVSGIGPAGPAAVKGFATLVGGVVVVNNAAIGAVGVSQVQLTAQDNNSTGTLRVSARVPGTSFTIQSSNPSDSGIVGWMILN